MYKYKGPYEVKRRISPLVYKVRTAEGTYVVLHVNRLKQAYGQNLRAVVSEKATGRSRKRHLSEQAVSDRVSKEIE